MTKPLPAGRGFVMSWCGTSGTPVHVDARHPLRDSSEDLIGDGSHEFREFVGGDRQTILLTDQGHAVAGHRSGDVRDVEGADIHTDTAHDGGEPSPYDGMRLVGQSAQ